MEERSHLHIDGLWSRVVRITVEIGRRQPCPLGSQDVGVEVIADHQRGFPLGTRLLESIVEILRSRLVVACIFAQDDGVEIIVESAGS